MEQTLDECIGLLKQEASEVQASILKQQEYLHQVNDELAGYMREKSELLKFVINSNPHVAPYNWSSNLELLAHYRLGIEYGAKHGAEKCLKHARGAIIAVQDSARWRGEPEKSKLLAIATQMETELMDVLQQKE